MEALAWVRFGGLAAVLVSRGDQEGLRPLDFRSTAEILRYTWLRWLALVWCVNRVERYQLPLQKKLFVYQI